MADINRTSKGFASPNVQRDSVFISYSPEDRKYLEELQDHLAFYKRTSNLKVWDNTQIRGGADWRRETEEALLSTKVAVFPISADYLASDSIAEGELATLLASARQDSVTILCVIVGYCSFKDSELAQFREVNDASNPLDTMSRAQRNKVWGQVVQLIQNILKDGQEKTPSVSPVCGTSSSHAPVEQGTLPSAQQGSKPAFVKQGAGNTLLSICDVCVICAMGEEVEAFILETARLCNTSFKSIVGSQTRRDYRYATIQNDKGESLTLYVTWPPKYGPEEMGLHFKAVLDELKPRFTAMAGICAGNREKTSLGDIIVAERAFRSDTGKIIPGEGDRKRQEYDTNTYGPDPNTLQFVQMFDAWKSVVAGLPRPISKRQQRDWLLDTLFQDTTMSLYDIPLKDLRQNAPDWRAIVLDLQQESDRYLTDDGRLYDRGKVQKLYRTTDFPYKDEAYPRRHIVPMASGSAVRSDNPFEDVRTPVRGTIAIDMEGATFYRTTMEFPGIRSLLVKGVSDYADLEKDDSYHAYAAAVSSAYLLCFIKGYVNSERMPIGG